MVFNPLFLCMILQVFILIAYICVQATLNCVNMSTFEYYKFISIFCFITTAILYGILLLKLQVRILRCDCAQARWPIFVSIALGLTLTFQCFHDLVLIIIIMITCAKWMFKNSQVYSSVCSIGLLFCVSVVNNNDLEYSNNSERKKSKRCCILYCNLLFFVLFNISLHYILLFPRLRF